MLGADGGLQWHHRVKLRSRWAAGDSRGPARVRIHESLQLVNGIRMHNLPLSSREFPNSMPDVDASVVHHLLGKTVIEISGDTTPSFFRPSMTDADTYAVQSRVALGDISLQLVIVALSLVSNCRVDCALLWSDQCEARALDDGGMSLLVRLEPRKRLYSGSVCTIRRQETEVAETYESPTPTPNLIADDAQRPWDLVPELIRRMAEDERFKVAVNRWMEAVSHDSRSMDRLIDLRIALEALYIDSERGELSFRLALTAARHLGADIDERRAIQRSLREFYTLTSRAVHGVAISRLKDTNVALIEQATKLCRDGILKIVETKDRRNWGDLLLS